MRISVALVALIWFVVGTLIGVGQATSKSMSPVPVSPFTGSPIVPDIICPGVLVWPRGGITPGMEVIDWIPVDVDLIVRLLFALHPALFMDERATCLP